MTRPDLAAGQRAMADVIRSGEYVEASAELHARAADELERLAGQAVNISRSEAHWRQKAEHLEALNRSAAAELERAGVLRCVVASLIRDDWERAVNGDPNHCPLCDMLSLRSGKLGRDRHHWTCPVYLAYDALPPAPSTEEAT